MINLKNYIKFVSEKNIFDPYGEDVWADAKIFVVSAVGLQELIVYATDTSENKDEVLEEFERETGVTDEYGDLKVEEISRNDFNEILRKKTERRNELNEELDRLNEEIESLNNVTQ
jgi:predicted ATP-dependent protease